MQDFFAPFLAWIPLLPLLGFVLLIALPLFHRREPPEAVSAVVGVGSVCLSALLTLLIMWTLFLNNPSAVLQVSLWQWLKVGALQLGFDFYLDWLGMAMLLVVTGVGFLIHLYSAGYMHGDDGYRRYFAYLNLFVGAMLILVMADNLLLLYLGWEGVGLCSYLLIGFWYRNSANGDAARKAFIVTRIGDTAMLLGLILLFSQFGTLSIRALNTAAASAPANNLTVTLAALLLLGGAVGKSAQLPLQTWLPDAMAGPTPVSALIHAATMVTAGVYLIARMHPLFNASETAMSAVGIVGALTLLLAGFSAMVQSDIKRVLAYSTISQIGYMFLALGVGAWTGAIFHLMTHAFFKALLFLSAGSVILSLHHEQSLFSMGGLRRKLPFTFGCFAIGCASLAALPFTAGFYSKDQILLKAWEYQGGFNGIWFTGILGALITGFYSFRLLFLVFFGNDGPASARCKDANNGVMTLPLSVLAVLALFGGLLTPPLQRVFTQAPAGHAALWVEGVAIAAPILGLTLAWLLFRHNTSPMESRNKSALEKLWFSGWGFDWLYHRLLVQPLTSLARINRNDILNSIYNGTAFICRQLHNLLSTSQNGLIRWYIASFTCGAIIFLALLVVL
ncbi:NADH-quinone oxidoreductase subunit L [Microbulbifer thermotolerans]|uniref:NADH-quinone oxidoreductase subunit L n=1 Tax=Microbulbifer thermotolerans TaxID=252514 RepID=UPI002673C44E|nr:NADH-quinone oxidoreductase subunit L [Microbulbifer thermotolerans]WKT59623.1 NADH-quinone oxidoreductase subunit L [Microbulbifer thermotolerans]